MEDNSFLQNYGDDDVLSSASGMFKVGKLTEAMKKAFGVSSLQTALNDVLKSEGVEISTTFYNPSLRTHCQKNWLGEGVDCEILQIGAKGWQKGKLRIRVTVDFCPDEPDVEEIQASDKPKIAQSESPLDDIRQMMKENS